MEKFLDLIAKFRILIGKDYCADQGENIRTDKIEAEIDLAYSCLTDSERSRAILKAFAVVCEPSRDHRYNTVLIGRAYELAKNLLAIKL